MKTFDAVLTIKSKHTTTTEILFQSNGGDAPHGGTFWVKSALHHSAGAWSSSQEGSKCLLSEHSYWKKIPFDHFPAILLENFDGEKYGLLVEKVKEIGQTNMIAVVNGLGQVQFRREKDVLAFRECYEGGVELALEGMTLGVKNWSIECEGQLDLLPDRCYGRWIKGVKMVDAIKRSYIPIKPEEGCQWSSEILYEIEWEDEEWCQHLPEGFSWTVSFRARDF
mmetsp:Transcript_36344/g.41422  ORF Transcript_36344/g.41422 Transcript_36344/m.41422 type:complete len:223 (+) Transcript_36344:1549-2217(+)|eukprot:CAMPEP_0114981378 /NCGR_PEP_ID=MMETSP0216-20121206/5511_1 /TAXON_ID=223996 /ORGANISM="Protocruzia adherens, Strain Boccale" /LENGTH=222 /DNA_ID=CAMNT_0002343043 /DNA_START=1536 /DNA_END=2204 /DNA_ORIENTATION=+